MSPLQGEEDYLNDVNRGWRAKRLPPATVGNRYAVKKSTHLIETAGGARLQTLPSTIDDRRSAVRGPRSAVGDARRSAVFRRSLSSEEPGVHQVPIDQAGGEADDQHQQYQNLVPRRLGFSGPRREEQQEESAHPDDRRERCELEGVLPFVEQLLPVVIDETDGSHDQDQGE